MEKKNTAKLIRHKRKQRNLLLDLLVGVAGGAVLAGGTVLMLVLYCYRGTACEEVRKMKRVPTLMYEAEFQDFLDKQKRAVEEMKRDGLDYMSRLCRLWGRVTATAGEENEKCFTAGQLDQIFDLAK